MQSVGVVEADDVLVEAGLDFQRIGIALLLQALHRQVQEEAFHDGELESRVKATPTG